MRLVRKAVKRFVIAIGIVFATAAFALNAPDADADDASYLAATNGLYHSIYGPDTMLHWGHGICDDLHSGRSFDQEVAMAPPTMAGYMDVPGVIRAAQRELCPDTIR